MWMVRIPRHCSSIWNHRKEASLEMELNGTSPNFLSIKMARLLGDMLLQLLLWRYRWVSLPANYIVAYLCSIKCWCISLLRFLQNDIEKLLGTVSYDLFAWITCSDLVCQSPELYNSLKIRSSDISVCVPYSWNCNGLVSSNFAWCIKCCLYNIVPCSGLYMKVTKDMNSSWKCLWCLAGTHALNAVLAPWYSWCETEITESYLSILKPRRGPGQGDGLHDRRIAIRRSEINR